MMGKIEYTSDLQRDLDSKGQSCWRFILSLLTGLAPSFLFSKLTVIRPNETGTAKRLNPAILQNWDYAVPTTALYPVCLKSQLSTAKALIVSLTL